MIRKFNRMRTGCHRDCQESIREFTGLGSYAVNGNAPAFIIGNRSKEQAVGYRVDLAGYRRARQ